MQSETLGELAAALSAVQAALRPAAKNATNPHFRSRFADLESCWDACRAPLAANGLAVIQTVDHPTAFAPLAGLVDVMKAAGLEDTHPLVLKTKDLMAKAGPVSGPRLLTTLVHKSGEFISSAIPLHPKKPNDPQALGSALTYARRYGLCGIVGIVAGDDDDGNGAQQELRPQQNQLRPQQAQSPPRTQQKANPPESATQTVADPRAIEIDLNRLISEMVPKSKNAGISWRICAEEAPSYLHSLMAKTEEKAVRDHCGAALAWRRRQQENALVLAVRKKLRLGESGKLTPEQHLEVISWCEDHMPEETAIAHKGTLSTFLPELTSKGLKALTEEAIL